MSRFQNFAADLQKTQDLLFRVAGVKKKLRSARFLETALCAVLIVLLIRIISGQTFCEVVFFTACHRRKVRV